MKLIGLTATKQSGKTTAVEELCRIQDKVTVLKFAGTLKKMIHVLLQDLGYNIDDCNRFTDGTEDDKNYIIPELGVSCRRLMQTLGTEWGKMLINPQIWNRCLDYALINVNKHYGYDPRGNRLVVIDDLRDQLEVDFIKAKGGKTIRIARMTDDVTSKAMVADTHSSETQVAGLLVDDVVINDESKRVLGARVADSIERLYK